RGAGIHEQPGRDSPVEDGLDDHVASGFVPGAHHVMLEIPGHGLELPAYPGVVVRLPAPGAPPELLAFVALQIVAQPSERVEIRLELPALPVSLLLAPVSRFLAAGLRVLVQLVEALRVIRHAAAGFELPAIDLPPAGGGGTRDPEDVGSFQRDRAVADV